MHCKSMAYDPVEKQFSTKYCTHLMYYVYSSSFYLLLCYRIPQLLTCLVRSEGRLIMNLLSQVGRMYPQAVYFPIRTLYLTLKIEQRERCKS